VTRDSAETLKKIQRHGTRLHSASVTEVSADDVREFAQSMPATYRKGYEPAAIAAHARLAEERADSSVIVGVFHSNRAPGTALCVIADDRPGLLALISAAFVLSGLDVMDAEAYTRETRAGRREAIDVFWVRHADIEQRKNRVSKDELAKLRLTLNELLAGRLDPREADVRRRHAEVPQGAGTVVRFLEGDDGKLTTLEVETSDRSGLLLALSKALYEQRVQIVSSAVRTLQNRVYDRFVILELDGSAISAPRRLEIQVAVMSAVQTAPAA
jgi:[protein-PII] uridylyltransferase